MGWVGVCAKSFSSLTKVMLGYVELWLTWGFEKKITKTQTKIDISKIPIEIIK